MLPELQEISYLAPAKFSSRIIQHTILLTDISAGDFLPTQDCVRDWSVNSNKNRGIDPGKNSQSVSAFRGASKMPAITVTDE